MINKRYDDAEKAYRYALKYYPEDGPLNTDLASLLLNLSHSTPEETLKYALKGAEILPNSGRSHYILAYAYAFSENWHASQKALLECLKYPPKPQGYDILEGEIKEKLGINELMI